jgi:hypothetical protein
LLKEEEHTPSRLCVACRSGPIIYESGAIKVDEYIAHRAQREREILEILRQTKKSLTPRLTSWQIVHKIYADLPVHLKVLLDPYLSEWIKLARLLTLAVVRVQISAQASVLHHLRKLEKDGLVRRGWPDLWNARGSASDD